MSNKIHAGAQFPDITLSDLEGNKHLLSEPHNGADWKLVVVYRGRHCPMCTKFLNKLEEISLKGKNKTEVYQALTNIFRITKTEEKK